MELLEHARNMQHVHVVHVLTYDVLVEDPTLFRCFELDVGSKVLIACTILGRLRSSSTLSPDNVSPVALDAVQFI